MMQIRAEKTTRNYDDFKVLIIGVMISVLMLLGFPLMGQTYDKFFAERPFITATLQIVQTEDYSLPMFLYDADAKQISDATWVAIIRNEEGHRLDSRRGFGTYSTKEDNPILWTWSAFFDNETGTIPPQVPENPFKVCLQYYSEARDSGVPDETPETCSPIFYPNKEEV